MAFGTGPNIVTDGLVFGYDADERSSRFYKGEPTTNLSTTSEAFISGTSSNLNGTWQYGAVTLNNNSVVTEDLKFNNAYQFTFHDATTGNWDMYRRFDSILSGTVYTISMYVKLGTATNFCIIVNNTNAWNTITGKCFTVSDGLNTSTYTRVSITFTGASTNAVNIHLGRHYETVVTQQTNGTVFITGLQMEQKTHATQYLRNTSTSTSVTRSYNQSLIDLKRITSIDLSNVSFDSTAHPVFDGVDDYIDLGSHLNNLGSTATFECIFKSINTTNLYKVLLGWGYGTTMYGGISIGDYTGAYSDESLSFTVNGGFGDQMIFHVREGATKYADNDYHHVIITSGQNSYKVYIDGIEKTITFENGSQSSTYTQIIGYNENVNSYIGKRPYTGSEGYFNGYIPVVKIYNKILSNTEIQQNFNSYKYRFNI